MNTKGNKTMPKVMLEINDNLDDYVSSAIDSVKELLLQFLEENEPDELPCLNNDLDYSGSVHEIIDSAVPIYTQEIDDTWYLNKGALKQAFDNAGCYDKNEKPENYEAVCIYFYIQEKVSEWYDEKAQEIFDEWLAKQNEEVMPCLENK